MREGKVRYIGASNYTGWQLATALGVCRAHGWEPYVSIQPQYSLVTREIERELFPLAEYAGLAVLPWSPLGGGLLSGKYQSGAEPAADTRAADSTPSAVLMRLRMQEDRNFAVAAAVRELASELGKTMAQVALNWVLHRPGVTAPILGARTVPQIEDNLGAIGWRLDDASLARLEDASAIPMGYPYDFIDWIHGR